MTIISLKGFNILSIILYILASLANNALKRGD